MKVKIAIVFVTLLVTCLHSSWADDGFIVYDVTSFANAPKPLPGNKPSYALYDKELLDGSWVQKIANYPETGLLFLNMEHQDWIEVDGLASALMRDLRRVRPKMTYLVYPLGRREWHYKDPSRYKEWTEENDKFMRQLGTAGRDVDRTGGEVYVNFGHGLDWQRDYWRSQIAECVRLAEENSIKPCPVICCSPRMTSKDWTYGAPFSEEVWQELIDILNEHYITEVAHWHGWLMSDHATKHDVVGGIRDWHVVSKPCLRDALGLISQNPEDSNDSWWLHDWQSPGNGEQLQLLNTMLVGDDDDDDDDDDEDDD